MPKAFDRMQLAISHDPIQRIIEEIPRTPEFIPPWLVGPFELIQQIIDALMQGFHGWTQTGFPVEALSTLTNAIGIGLGELNHVAMRVAALEGQIVDAIENFTTYVTGALDPSKWMQIYSSLTGGNSGGGLLSIGAQGYAVFQPVADTVNRVASAISTVVPTSDLQKVSAVLSVPANMGAQAANTILARVETSNPVANNVFAKLTDTNASVGFVKDGVTTVLGTVDNVLKNGATYTLDVTEPRTFTLIENSKPILKVVDAAAASALGAAFRSTGFGTIAPNSTSRPGVFAAFASYIK